MKKLGKAFRKYDADAIVTGKARYTKEFVPQDALVVTLLRSPHASCIIRTIDTTRAEKVPGIVGIYTYKDVPKTRFTLAGQSYPEPSPADRLILDRVIRYHNEPVCIIAGRSKKACLEGMKRIKIDYEVKKPLLDPKEALDHPQIVHEEDVHYLSGDEIFGFEPERNLVGRIRRRFGEDFEEIYPRSKVKLSQEYSVFPQAHAMMESYRSYTYLDEYNRLHVISSTQVPFHIKRQLARALEIPTSRIRIKKPRVGGGFGGKQTSVTEIYPALVTMKTGLPAYLELDRRETFSATNSRHAMNIGVKIGSDEKGNIEAISIDALSDQGAYGEHAFTTLGLVGDKSLPLYPHIKSATFDGKVVYTNKMPGAAFRGYGAVQGIYALESAVNELAHKIQMDPVDLRLKNIVEEGDRTTAYQMKINSCRLKDCIRRGKELIGWDEIYPRKIKNGKIISVGMACAMQGSGIASVDTSTVEIRLNEQGEYTLFMSPTDTGTGTDTIMIKIAAEALDCDEEDIIPIVADTDITPFDPGSYASSGVYITGSAVYNAAEDLKDMIRREAAKSLNTYPSWIDIKNGNIYQGKKKIMSISSLAKELASGPGGKNIVGIGHFDSKVSPPPYMAGFAKIEIDPQKASIKVLEYGAVVDCGTVMSENLARVQVEGGIVQSIGYTLYEDTHWDKSGKMLEDTFLNYKIPTRKEVGQMKVEFCPSYEPTGPYGAKSIGELVSNTPAPAITGAILNGIGVAMNKIPITRNDLRKALEKTEFSKFQYEYF
ncbi:MAG: molybdopterin-dependent oxidoreductase [Tissierellia bacterium]|nr:molybdopterin-dependent oxidoreductase [Tissierellia bacterium]